MAVGNYSKRIADYQAKIRKMETLEVELKTNVSNKKEQLSEVDKEISALGIDPKDAGKRVKELETKIENICSKLDSSLPSGPVDSIDDILAQVEEDEDDSF